MHLPSAELRRELLSVPQFARFNMSLGDTGLEPTLIIKASTLTLKYLIRRSSFHILIRQLPSGKLMYGVLIDEYDKKPAMTWALVEAEQEMTALIALYKAKTCTVFLFNEACVSVCSSEPTFTVNQTLEENITQPLVFSSPVRDKADSEEAERAMGDFFSATNFVAAIETSGKLQWKETHNHYITNQFVASPISILSENEGSQQEELCTWLLDTLSPDGAYKNPEVHETTKVRELTDVLINYLGGCFLIESKTLAILDRDELPDRSKLRKNVLKNIKKAVLQLPGACRNIVAGYKVTSASGQIIQVTPGIPIHCIVLAPDLGLLQSDDDLGGSKLRAFMEETGCYLHFLDPSELLRLVQTALHMASLSQKTTKMLSFDVVLIDRWKRACDLDTPNFTMIVHFE